MQEKGDVTNLLIQQASNKQLAITVYRHEAPTEEYYDEKAVEILNEFMNLDWNMPRWFQQMLEEHGFEPDWKDEEGQ